MLAPILEGAAAWQPPVTWRETFGQTHFALRAAERGVQSVSGGLLCWAVVAALDAGRCDLVAPVFRICPESTLYRILLPEGVFFPVVRNGRPVTIYSAAEVRTLRAARRRSKRAQGTRQRRQASA